LGQITPIAGALRIQLATVYYDSRKIQQQCCITGLTPDPSPDRTPEPWRYHIGIVEVKRVENVLLDLHIFYTKIQKGNQVKPNCRTV